MKFSDYVKPATGQAIDNFIGMCIVSSAFMHTQHFTTKSYARHKTLNAYFDKMPDLIDTFVERYLGAGGTYTYVLPTIGADVTAEQVLKSIVDASANVYPLVSQDCVSALDEVVGLCHQTLYLLTFS